MRIAIASTHVPFVGGGGVKIVDELALVLKERGLTVDVIQFPLHSWWEDLPRQYAALRCFDLTEAGGEKIDLLLCVRYPSYALPHPNKKVWFLHHHRAAFDLQHTPLGDWPAGPQPDAVREQLQRADTQYLRECQGVFPISNTVANRIRKFNEVEPTDVLYPPLYKPDLFHADEPNNYFFYPSRLNPMKRQDLAIQAMQHVKGDFTLRLTGAPDVGAYEQQLRDLAQSLGVDDKVEFTGFLSEKEKADIMAQSLGVLYLPFDEDGPGYVTLEAFQSRKPVITAHDAGGPRELVEHQRNGWVIDPDAQQLAEAMDQLFSNKQKAKQMGQEAFACLAEHRLDWDYVVERLVA